MREVKGCSSETVARTPCRWVLLRTLNRSGINTLPWLTLTGISFPDFFIGVSRWLYIETFSYPLWNDYTSWSQIYHNLWNISRSSRNRSILFHHHNTVSSKFSIRLLDLSFWRPPNNFYFGFFHWQTKYYLLTYFFNLVDNLPDCGFQNADCVIFELGFHLWLWEFSFSILERTPKNSPPLAGGDGGEGERRDHIHPHPNPLPSMA